ncbi:MauE/DoxX family redox-associated membrane protein [Sphingobacterium lumbrici]|uniref:MauE/DoxX family redox-associated membrane protein n=1 Tax=Sphingobacterium lumbrici TaxID=2559600 RepID=UPI0015E34F5B|nr:MauE/DoxX family redox-associated membrane protein [Sphingobacterium lumbrici]
MKKKQKIVNIIIVVLLFLWIPITIDKLYNFEVFKAGIYRQPFSNKLGEALIYTLPFTELVIGILLIIRKSRHIGFALSSLMMALFTNYVGMALLLGKTGLPCSCGSVIPKLGWTWHFWFNLVFLSLSIIGYFLQRHLNRNGAFRENSATGPSSAKRRNTINFIKHLNCTK